MADNSTGGAATKNRKDWFEWNGINSAVFGITMLQAPSFTLPKVRYTSVKIPGRSGNMVMMENDHTDLVVVNKSHTTGGSPDTSQQHELGYHQITTNEVKYAYDNVLLSCMCLIKTTDMIREIASWLRGYGVVRFGNRPDVYYSARIASQIAFQKVLRGNDYYTFTVSFDCEPTFLFYMEAGDIPVANDDGDEDKATGKG